MDLDFIDKIADIDSVNQLNNKEIHDLREHFKDGADRYSVGLDRLNRLEQRQEHISKKIDDLKKGVQDAN